MAAACGLLASSLPAQAQERAPAERQTLSELAYSLGEAHALKRLCAGRRDGTWYSRMRRLIEVESADEGLRRALVEAFNAGYMTRSAEFDRCSSDVQAAERDAAARGRALARRLAR